MYKNIKLLHHTPETYIINQLYSIKRKKLWLYISNFCNNWLRLWLIKNNWACILYVHEYECLCCHFIFPSNPFLLCFMKVLVCDELEQGARGNQSTGPSPRSVWEIQLNCLIFCWGLQNSILGKQQWITLEGTYSNETIKARRQQNKLKTSSDYMFCTQDTLQRHGQKGKEDILCRR